MRIRIFIRFNPPGLTWITLTRKNAGLKGVQQGPGASLAKGTKRTKFYPQMNVADAGG
jgi:hypothetical protein